MNSFKQRLSNLRSCFWFLSAGDHEGDLHHQRHRISEHGAAQGGQKSVSFPSDDAVLKLFYLAIRNISRKWTAVIRDWKGTLKRFTIQFDDRMPQH